jgi:acetylornithine deacetylase/succinyl-diaminopimelate desuccinylase-like protein
VLVVVDEEVGGYEGAHWLTTERPDLCRCDFLLNEGGGSVMPVGEQRAYGVSIAEKGVFRFTVTTRGEAGHAGMPGVSDNALPKLAPLLAALASPPERWDLTDAPRGLLDALGYGRVDDDPSGTLARFRSDAPDIAAFVDPMSSVTFAPTRAGASEKINVIPARAWVKVDCRTPPGMGREGAEERIRGALDVAGVDYDLTFDEEVVGNASSAETPLMEAIAAWMGREEPAATVVPTMIPAFTDSRHFREAFPECVAYGFFPQRGRTLPEMWRMMHARDERIGVDDLGWAARCYRDLATELLG